MDQPSSSGHERITTNAELYGDACVGVGVFSLVFFLVVYTRVVLLVQSKGCRPVLATQHFIHYSALVSSVVTLVEFRDLIGFPAVFPLWLEGCIYQVRFSCFVNSLAAAAIGLSFCFFFSWLCV